VPNPLKDPESCMEKNSVGQTVLETAISREGG
jgi:hypothetical protein